MCSGRTAASSLRRRRYSGSSSAGQSSIATRLVVRVLWSRKQTGFNFDTQVLVRASLAKLKWTDCPARSKRIKIVPINRNSYGVRESTRYFCVSIYL
jgi:hypothetical protein